MNRDFKSNILIVGDVMLDRYWWGSVSRISPEAPVPIVNLEKTTVALGGAANVAANVAGLGCDPFLIGLIGDDSEGELLMEESKRRKIRTDYLIKNSSRPTIVKSRVVAHGQQIVRIDQEVKIPVTASEEEEISATIKNLLPEIDIVIVSDYGKGIVSENVSARLITKASEANKIILIDPKGKNYQKYKSASLLTPNRHELAEVCRLENYEQKTIEDAGEKMLAELNLKSLLVTQGEDGMTLFEKNKPAVHLPVTARNVYDVTGAGDTVIASLAVALSKGEPLSAAANFANQCAGLVVEQLGTTAISLDLIEDFRNHIVNE